MIRSRPRSRSFNRQLASLASCLLAACAGENGNDAGLATFETTACDVSLLPAGQDLASMECGFLTVPESRGRSSGRMIKLATAVLRATGDDPAPDPLVLLSGGPGQWALATLMPLLTADFAAPLQSKRDLVVFDQRGTGRSEPALDCPEILASRDAFADLLTPEQEAERDARDSLTCRDRLVEDGVDLGAYTSAATAQDIADLMRVLGYDRFNLYGLSYGSRVALTALRDLPDGSIRSVVLDSVVPVQAAWGVDYVGPLQTQRSLDLLFRDCAADPGCNRSYPELEQQAFGLFARLDAEPLNPEPTDPSGEAFPVVLTGDRLISLTGLALQQAGLIPLLPLFTSSVARGDTALLTAALMVLGGPEPSSRGAQTSVLCNEETPFVTSEIIATAYERGDPAILRAYANPDRLRRVCPQWGGAPPDPIENQPVRSDVPALIFAGEYDTATPPELGRLAAETLPKSFYFEFRGLGHVVLSQQAAPDGPPACAMRVMAEFLEDPSRAPDGSCAAALPPPAFVAG